MREMEEEEEEREEERNEKKRRRIKRKRGRGTGRTNSNASGSCRRRRSNSRRARVAPPESWGNNLPTVRMVINNGAASRAVQPVSINSSNSSSSRRASRCGGDGRQHYPQHGGVGTRMGMDARGRWNLGGDGFPPFSPE